MERILIPSESHEELVEVMALLLVAPVLASGEFQFRIPDGFRDLSPGAPEANFAGLPDALTAEAKSGKFTAFGIEFPADDDFAENFNAVVSPGALYIDTKRLDEEVKKFSRSTSGHSGRRRRSSAASSYRSAGSSRFAS